MTAVACICVIAITGAAVSAVNRNTKDEPGKETAKTYEIPKKETPSIIDIAVLPSAETNVNEVPEKKNEEQVKTNSGSAIRLTPTILYDNVGIGAFYTFLPEGWTAKVNTSFTVDQVYPLQSDIVLKSADGKTLIEIMTPMNYRQTANSDGNKSADDESHDILNYSTVLNYRNASEYIDYITAKAGFIWGQYNEIAGDSEAIKAYRKKMQNLGSDEVSFLQNYSDYNSGRKFNNKYTLTDYDAGIQIRRGNISKNNQGMLAEMTVYDGMYKYRNSYEIPNDLIYWSGWNDNTYWGIENFYFYVSTNQEDFDKYYDLAQFIMKNSGTTAMYDASKQAILNYIIPKVLEGNQEIMNYINDTVSDVVNNFNQTNDRVAQMWDDYILDQDRYTLSDGTQIVVPTTAEYVYYDGSDVLWSNSPNFDPGSGYVQIN